MQFLDAAGTGCFNCTVNIQRIKDRISNGFKPFTICLSDGRKLNVPSADFIAVGNGIVVVIGKADHVYTINPLHITTLEERFSKAS